MSDSLDGRDPQYIVAEYQAATDAYLHYDSFRWESGALLVAGSFVFLGFIATSATGIPLDFGALAVTFVMCAWLLYAQHHRNLYLFKLDRIAELEVTMGAEQNLRFRGGPGAQFTYPKVGVAGHWLDRITALGISASALTLTLVKDSSGWFSIAAIVLICMTEIWVVGQDRHVNAVLKLKAQLTEATAPSQPKSRRRRFLVLGVERPSRHR